MNTERPVWAEVSLSAIRNNMAAIQTAITPRTPGGKKPIFCPVIKANGYGHGAVVMGQEAVRAGAEYVAVALLQEALELREAGISLPILALNYTPENAAEELVGNTITQTVYEKCHLDALSSAAQSTGKTANVHVKIDTGMTRIGIRPKDAPEFCRYADSLPGIHLEGVYTHLATADGTTTGELAYAEKQFTLFQQALTAIRACGIHPTITHCANSAATLFLPHTHLDMVRPGIILYGLPPAQSLPLPPEFVPPLSLKARISMLKTVPTGTSVSYGATITTTRETLVATIPLGYADGYTRMLSNRVSASIHGQRIHGIGRICMDQCMFDATDATIPTSSTPNSPTRPVHKDDIVTLFGPHDVRADDLAAILNTINYEILCMVGSRVKRVYVE